MVDEDVRPGACAAGCWSPRSPAPGSTRSTLARRGGGPGGAGLRGDRPRDAEPAGAAGPARRTRPGGGRRRRVAAAPRSASSAAEDALAEAQRGPRRGDRRRRGARGPRHAGPGGDRRAASGKVAELEATSEEVDEELADAEDVAGRGRVDAVRARRPEGPRRRGCRAESTLSSAAQSAQPLERLDGVAPAGVGGVGGRPVAGRLEAAVELPGLAEVVGRGPDAGAEAGEERRAERRGLDDLRPLDGYADLVGLDLAEQVVGGGAAVDPQRGRAAPASSRARRAPRTRSPPGWRGRCGRGWCRG